MQPIESIQAGTLVWSHNLNTNQWVLCEVLRPQSRMYEGDIVSITIETEDGSIETIEATGNHPFWITEGDELDSRPTVSELTPAEQAMNIDRHGGRWTEARHLRLSDVFLTKTSRSATVSGLTIRIERIRVYNLHVNELQLYAVSGVGILVHNSNPRWPRNKEEMDKFLGFPGTRKPDGPSTPGRGKVEWRPNSSTKIILERHPYHPNSPSKHSDWHWHIDTPKCTHERYLPGERIPGY